MHRCSGIPVPAVPFILKRCSGCTDTCCSQFYRCANGNDPSADSVYLGLCIHTYTVVKLGPAAVSMQLLRLFEMKGTAGMGMHRTTVYYCVGAHYSMPL